MTDPTPLILAAIQDGLTTKRWLRPAPELTTGTTFAELDCDGVDMVCVTQAVDEAFGVEIPDEAAAAWVCVGDVVATVASLIGEAVGG